MTKTVLAALTGLTLACAPLAAEAQERRFTVADRYEVRGTNLNGTRYSGTARMRVLSSTTVAVRWTTGDTNSVSQGIGMRWDDTFAVGYVLQGKPGVVIYRIEPDGTMRGRWTVEGEDGVGQETLIPMR